MKISVFLNNGTFISIPVKWHPDFELNGNKISGGLYALSSDLENINKKIEKTNEYSDNKNIPLIRLEDIKGAEIPFSIYSNTDDNCPWKHNDALLRKIDFYDSIEWNV